MRWKGHARAQQRYGVSLDLYRDFSDTLRASGRTSAPRGEWERMVEHATRSLTKDEVVHDIGYDGLQLRLLDGVERKQRFREGLGKQRFELGFELVE